VTTDELVIRQIEDAGRGAQKIPASTVRSWLRNPSVKVLGAVTLHILNNSKRVEPPLTMEEICNTVQEYYKQCLIQGLDDGNYVPNRSIAGLEFVGWFQSLWRDSAVPREYVTRLKTMLRDLCMANEIPQDQVVGAVLEHLFETPQIAEFFADWRSEPKLREAYDLAMEWARDHWNRPSS
jgi:hypothetical protein